MKTTINISGVVSLPPADAGIQNAIVRLHNSRIDAHRQDKARFFRREPLVVINPDTGGKIVRYAMGAAGLAGVRKDTIALDYDALDALGIRPKQEVAITVRRATALEVYAWFWRHPDLSVQLSIRLGIAGAVLGVMGFITGLASFL